MLKPFRKKLQFCDQFKVLTWNYDLQFEIAYSRYKQISVPPCQRSIQSLPTLIPDGSEKFDSSKFSVIHLNGIAYGKADTFHGNTDLIGYFSSTGIQLMEYLTDVYHSISTVGLNQQVGGDKLLSFAWEKQREDESLIDNEILNYATLIAEQTEILVVIGYSFPIFNNPVDKKLFESMKGLKKVYVQSPNFADIESILLNFPNTAPDKIKNAGYFSQFHIPIEWNKNWNKDISQFS